MDGIRTSLTTSLRNIVALTLTQFKLNASRKAVAVLALLTVLTKRTNSLKSAMDTILKLAFLARKKLNQGYFWDTCQAFRHPSHSFISSSQRASVIICVVSL